MTTALVSSSAHHDHPQRRHQANLPPRSVPMIDPDASVAGIPQQEPVTDPLSASMVGRQGGRR